MNTYAGLHARHYDLVYADKPYAEEARFVDSLLREAGVPHGALLDLACGTGRHARELAALGWEVTGIDYSEALLERARTNAPHSRFLLQDMRELDLPAVTFSAITCLFDSIGYALDDAGVDATLSAASRHLAPEGTLVVEFLHAPAMLAEADALRVRRFGITDDGDELVRISRTRVDEERRLMQVEFELIELRANGTYERWVETQSNRFFDPEEMRELLGQAGLRTERLVPAYREDRSIDESTFHVIAVARRQ
jgi:SAM-dependent methyltransferase